MLTEETLIILPDGTPWTGEGDRPKGAADVPSLVQRSASGDYITHWENLAPVRRTLIAEVKAAAGAWILEHLPAHDQMNMLGTSTLLIGRFGLSRDDRPDNVNDALDAFAECLSWVRSVRVASSTAIEALASAETFGDVIAVDTTLPAPPIDSINAADMATRQA